MKKFSIPIHTKMLFTFAFLSFSLLSAYAQEKEVILVAGYRNEEFQNYFSFIKKELIRQEFIPRLIRPISEKSVVSNSYTLAKEFSKINETFSIIAHSKGGIESILALLRNPELINKITSVFLIQSPINGSPYADRFWEESDRENSWNPFYYSYSRFNYSGFLSMRTNAVLEEINSLAKDVSKTALKELSQKLYYIRTFTRNPPSGYTEYTSYIEDLGLNDGLVPTDNMMLKAVRGIQPFGNDLGLFQDFHHMELVLLTHESRFSSTQNALKIIHETIIPNL